jgi:hypothetical protein
MGCRAFMAHGPEEKKRRRMPNGATVVFVAPFFSRCERDGPMLSSGALWVSLSDPTILITIHGWKGGRSSENERAKELKGDSREKRPHSVQW